VLDEWLLTPARAAVHLPTRTAVAADLHLGYDRVRRRGGEAVPARAIAEELSPLRDLLHRGKIQRLVIAGDLFEDSRYQREEMVEELLAWVEEARVELVGVVPGNHDRGLGGTLLPVCPGGIELGGWRIVHGDGERVEGPIVQGHEHPYLSCRPGAEGPCFLVAPGHLVLPAYSADAAGVNVLGAPRWSRYRCCAIAGERVLDFGELGELRKRL
jgi:putative SbcD/Mre11-related phosphoesterase